jgi:enoyl-CoA hydratase
MNFQTIRLEESNGVVRVTLNRPDARNAISIAMVTDLLKAGEYLEDECRARALVIRGAGDHFSMGIDLRDFPRDGKPNVEGFGRWEQVCRAIERLPMATVAAIDGDCAGGGLMLALACDVRVAAERAVFRLYEAPSGFIPGLGTFRLTKFIGLGRARRMALTGRKVDAAEAQRIGLVDLLCPAGDLERGVEEALAEFKDVQPEAHGLTRRLLDESYANSHEDFLGFFLAAQHRAVQTEAFRERVKKAHDSNSPQGDIPRS